MTSTLASRSLLRVGRSLVLGLAAIAAGCTGTGPITTPDSGPVGPVLDDCHSQADALANADCQLTLGTPKQGFVYPSGDREWYHLAFPASLPARPLLQVNAGISAPSSPVTLQLNVLQTLPTPPPDGGTNVASLALGDDPRTRGEPSPIVMTIPLTGNTGDFFFLLEDKPTDTVGGTGSDAQHPFTITVSASTDPDSAGHTEATATPITLTTTGEYASGSAGNGYADGGVLSTTGDVDYYSVVVPAMNRPILYVGLDAPALVPPPQSRITFTIYPDTDGGEAIGAASTYTTVGEQQTAIAKLLPGAGTYYIAVNAFQSDPTAPPPPGDTRLGYTLTTILISDLDTNEPNDTAATATPVTFSGSPSSTNTQTVTGRIAESPDPDWYQVTIPDSPNDNTLLQYQVSYVQNAPNNARYPAIDFFAVGGPDVNALVFSVAANAGDPDGGLEATACMDFCPADPKRNSDYCTRSTTQCVYSIRNEDFSKWPALDNFVGAIPVPAHSGNLSFLTLLEVPELASDDRAYQITFTWAPEPSNELTSYQNSLPTAPTLSIPYNNTYSEQPSGGTPATGDLAYGLFQPSDPGSTAPNMAPVIPINPIIDYDTFNDTDLWQYTLPTFPPILFGDGGLADAGIPDLSWSLAWMIPPAPSQVAMGMERPEDIFITFYFCDPAENGVEDGGSYCDPVYGTWHEASLGYRNGMLGSWYGGNPTAAYTFDEGSGSFEATSGQCLCIESRFVQGGTMYMGVSGVDCTSYENSQYSVTTSVAPYPQPTTNLDGGFCPIPCQECGGGNGGCPTTPMGGIPTGNPSIYP